jgi:hypothetical protein
MDEITINVYEINAMQYVHAVKGSPVKSTFSKAIEAGNFMRWTTLTSHYVKKYIKKFRGNN